MDHPLSKRDNKFSLSDASVAFVKSRLSKSADAVAFRTGFSGDVVQHAFLTQTHVCYVVCRTVVDPTKLPNILERNSFRKCCCKCSIQQRREGRSIWASVAISMYELIGNQYRLCPLALLSSIRVSRFRTCVPSFLMSEIFLNREHRILYPQYICSGCHCICRESSRWDIQRTSHQTGIFRQTR